MASLLESGTVHSGYSTKSAVTSNTAMESVTGNPGPGSLTDTSNNFEKGALITDAPRRGLHNALPLRLEINLRRAIVTTRAESTRESSVFVIERDGYNPSQLLNDQTRKPTEA
ncbi:hypothetical protein OF83DRAFT_1173166 [Amylostereum chailletii]|nr:hypothetical protein OF83DRAFT_1173166 [Amylostereum chailletii]